MALNSWPRRGVCDQELKVLFASGYLNYSVLRCGLDPGIEKVSKPYWPDELAAKLREILDSHTPVADDR
jgi:hypothetical protein